MEKMRASETKATGGGRDSGRDSGADSGDGKDNVLSSPEVTLKSDPDDSEEEELPVASGVVAKSPVQASKQKRKRRKR